MVTVVVVGTGLTVDRSVSEDVVDHAQPGVRHGHDDFLRPELPQYPTEAGLQGAVLGPARPGRRLDQRRAQPSVALPGLAGLVCAPTTLVLLGQVLKLRARSATSGAIRALLSLAPKTARRLRDDGTVSWLGSGGGTAQLGPPGCLSPAAPSVGGDPAGELRRSVRAALPRLNL